MTAQQRPTLAAWMSRALYDEGFGYYSAGRVRFGHDDDFWTFPQELSPVFGRLFAERIAEMAAVLDDAGQLGPDTPLTIVELGAGDGTLARDILDALAAPAPCARLQRGHALAADRLRYRVGERSAALRTAQRRAWGHHATTVGWRGEPRVDHLAQPAGALVARLPDIVGAVIHNELLDVFPHERVQLGADPADDRVLTLQAHVPGPDGRPGDALDARSLWARCRAHAERTAQGDGDALGPLAIEAHWRAGLGEASRSAAYLAELRPLAAAATARMQRAHPGARAAPWVCPGIDPLVQAVAGALRAGWMWTIDYGGSALHTLDPAPSMPALRCYPPVRDADGEPVLRAGPLPTLLGWPGSRDITLDIDFSHLASAGQREGLAPLWFGPQVGLRTPASPTEPLAPGARRQVEDRHRARAGVGAIEAARRVWAATQRFVAGSPGFRLLVQGTANVPTDGLRFPLAGLAVLPSELRWPSPAVVTAPQALRALVATAIDDAGLGDDAALIDAGVSAVLHAATRPASLQLLLDERGLRHATRTIEGGLAERGWLTGDEREDWSSRVVARR